MAQASKLPNVLPKTSNFTVNVRLLPGDSVTSVLDYLKRLSSDHKVQIETLLAHEASPISTLDNDFYRLLQKLIARFYPAAITTPYLVMGGTDSRHYYALSDSVYRFTPIHISSTEQELIHNTNERLSTENYARMLKFYKSLLAVL